VILNNVHLMPRWLYELEKKLDVFAEEGSNERFRLFLSSDPSNGIPIGVLNRSIKLTNEPPAGMKAGLKAAFCSMNKGVFDEFESKTKSITFGLCCFHATLVERKKFGAKGYNMMYPFALGDLRDSAVCLVNYMENAGSKIPWADLKYIFGEIMYGGHIVNDFDRRMALAYLDWYMDDPLLDETELFPFAEDEKGVSFKSPSPTSYDKYVEHIETEFKRDTPIALGLHPNAEIGFRTDQSNELFNILRELQPKTDDGEGSDSQSPQHIAENVLNEILEKYAEVKFDLEDIERSLEEKGPYENVFLQECEQMNTLIVEMVRSLLELNLGFAGELTMTDAMEDLMNSLFMDTVPASWAKRAWPSKRPLASWLFDMGQRVAQLQDCVASNLEVPKCVWISGLVNPQSFLTAIMQMTAQRNNLELDKLTIATDVTKRQVDDLEGPSRDGAYISGLSIQGARWDANAQLVEKSRPKEMSCPIPVINCKAVASEGRDTKGIYMCPTYKTEDRGPTFVFVAQLKTKAKASRWVLAGVAMIMDIVE
jgi:dynein heavy chain